MTTNTTTGHPIEDYIVGAYYWVISALDPDCDKSANMEPEPAEYLGDGKWSLLGTETDWPVRWVGQQIVYKFEVPPEQQARRDACNNWLNSRPKGNCVDDLISTYQDDAELARDLLIYGTAVSKDGKRIDPKDVFINPLDDARMKALDAVEAMFKYNSGDDVDAHVMAIKAAMLMDFHYNTLRSCLTQPVPSPIVGGDVKEALDAKNALLDFEQMWRFIEMSNPYWGTVNNDFMRPHFKETIIKILRDYPVTHAPALDAVKGAEGYKLVPIEPTQAMIDAAFKCVADTGEDWMEFTDIYKAMIGVSDEYKN